MAINTLNTLITDAAFNIPQGCDSTDKALISMLDALFAECCALILERDASLNLKRAIAKEYGAKPSMTPFDPSVNVGNGLSDATTIS